MYTNYVMYTNYKYLHRGEVSTPSLSPLCWTTQRENDISVISAYESENHVSL